MSQQLEINNFNSADSNQNPNSEKNLPYAVNGKELLYWLFFFLL